MTKPDCAFCALDGSERVFFEDNLIRALWDGFPVSPGHALVVPRRHVANWFDASLEEQAALMRGLDVARARILERYQPDGFNIGINVGEAAGQTVFHLHLHLIPRYKGDVPDPRGGVRCVIPARARYWE
jgi:ATP adenylyltransferase